MKTLETFITVHDQEILLECENTNKYKYISNYKYIFVGMRDTSKIDRLNNVIIANKLPHNIEQYKYLVDYTAWYALVKNSLITSPYIALIQYDTFVSKNFEDKTMQVLKNNPNQFLGYVPYSMLSEDFLIKNIGAEPLSTAINTIYHIDIYNLVNNYIKKTNDTFWQSSNNVATSLPTLTNFVEWFEPLIINIIKFKGCGHAFERSIKIFSIINYLSNNYLPEVLKHQQLDSHATQHNSPEYVKRRQSLGNLGKKLRSILGKIRTV